MPPTSKRSATPVLAKDGKPSGSELSADQERSIQEIDSLYSAVGLVRSLKGNAGGVTQRMRSARRDRKGKPEAADGRELMQAAPVTTIAPNGVQFLRVAAWSGRTAGWLWHGFSTRIGGLSTAYAAEGAAGQLNLGFTAADQAELVAQNRRLLVEAVTGSAETPLISLRQIHSSVVVHAGSGGNWTGFADRNSPYRGDGLITDEPGVLLGVQTADCIPVLVADRRRRVVAAFHAGWRGTVKRIVESGVGRMRLEYGSRPEDLTAAIGPGIGVCCYSVGEEVLSEFRSQFVYGDQLFREVYDSDPVRTKYPMLFLTQRAPGHSAIGPELHVDLVEANRRQLLDAGLRPGAIHTTGGCTSCHRELFFSHRASQGHAGRMMSVIGIRPR